MAVRGTLALDLAGNELSAARRALARAIASGALGPGYEVAVEGSEIRFDGGARTDGPSAGRIEIHGDGRASFELELAWAERLRVLQAAVLAATVSFVATLLWSWFFFVALPVGAAVGVTWVVARVVGDRRRVRRHLRVLLRSLPLLVDERGQESR